MATMAKKRRIDNTVASDSQTQAAERGIDNLNSKEKRKGKEKGKMIVDEDPFEFSTDWDIDNYKREGESGEQWDLRKNFMLAHKKRFDEDRLVCLAQTFINMEFLGCKYPSETMQMVAELSKEIAEDFRKERSMRLKRTFVSASDAAEQRAKGKRKN